MSVAARGIGRLMARKLLIIRAPVAQNRQSKSHGAETMPPVRVRAAVYAGKLLVARP